MGITRKTGIALDAARLDYELGIRGLSADDLSARSGVPAPTLSRARHGRSMNANTVRAIVNALKAIPIDEELLALVAKPTNGGPDAKGRDAQPDVPHRVR